MAQWIRKHRTKLISLAIYVVLFALAAAWVVYGARHLGEGLSW